MRILFTTTGYPGHVLPLAPFASACVQAGHEVAVAGPRSAGPRVQTLGLEFCSCADLPAEEVAAVVDRAAQLDPQQAHELMIRVGFAETASRALLPDLLHVVGAWRPAVVVRESQDFAGALAAERHHVLHARVALGLASTEEETIALAAPALEEHRARLGLPADPAGGRLRAAPSFTLVPAELETPGRVPQQMTQRFRRDATPARPLPDWWPGNHDPLVYVSFGSVAASLGYFPDLYRDMAKALADCPIRVLMTTGADAAALGPLPANVHVERWFPQELVTGHAAAMVCHGGYGSVLDALAAGVPLVVIPLFARDQWYNARCIEHIGAGVVVDGSRSTMFSRPGLNEMAAVPDALARVLEDSTYRSAARHIADVIAALPPVSEAARALRDIVDPQPPG